MAVRRIPGELKSNSPSCEVTEFGDVNGTADMAEARINGRYPEHGFSLNHESDMMVYVLSGSGVVVYQESGFELHANQVVSIEKETPYYFEGADLRILMVCAPAWSPEQYEQINLE